MNAKDILKNAYVDVTLSYTELINAKEPLTMLAQQRFKVILAFKLSVTLKKLDDLVEKFYKTRKKILDDMGTLNPETNKYEFEPEKEKEAGIMIQQLLDQKNTISIVPVKLHEFEDERIEPRILSLLDWLVIE